jgi:hypothetical protein
MNATTDIVEERTNEVGRHVGAAAEGLHDFARDLRDEVGGGNVFSAAADEVARRGEGLAAYLRGCTTARLLGDIDRLARRAPLTVAAAGLVAGFAAARSFKMRPAAGGES